MIFHQTIKAEATRQQVLDLVLASTGIRIKDLQRLTGKSNTCIGSHLRKLDDAGMIECSHKTGHQCRWAPPGTWTVARSAGERKRPPPQEEAEILPLRRLYVVAGSVPPPQTLGLASVWELGTTT